MELGSKTLPSYARKLHGPNRGQRRGPPFRRSLLPGRLQGHPQRRGRGPLPARRPIAAGRTEHRTSCSSAGLEDRKGLPTSSKAFRLIRRAAWRRVCSSSVRAQEREDRRYVLTRGLQTWSSWAVSDSEKAQFVQDGGRLRSAATGRESFGIVLLEAMAAGARSCAATSTATRAWSSAAARPSSCRRTTPSPAAGITELLEDPAMRARLGASGQARAEQFQLGERHGQGRGVLRLRDPRLAAGSAAARLLGRSPDRSTRGNRGGLRPAGRGGHVPRVAGPRSGGRGPAGGRGATFRRSRGHVPAVAGATFRRSRPPPAPAARRHPRPRHRHRRLSPDPLRRRPARFAEPPFGPPSPVPAVPHPRLRDRASHEQWRR